MLSRRSLTLFLAVALCLPLAAAELRPAATQAASTLAFANAQFAGVWNRTDAPVARASIARSWVWGPQPGEIRQEPFAGAPGGTRTVQYFDKARMEVNAAADPAGQWATTTGLLVVELVSGRVQTGPDSWETRAPAEIPVAGDGAPLAGGGTAPLYRSFREVASLPGGPDRRVAQATGAPVTATIDRAGAVGALPSSTVQYSAYAPETGHNIPDVFARFMASRDLMDEGGTLRQDALLDPTYVLGYPISEAYWATVPIDGKPQQVLIQLYQRRVLTYIPSFTPAWQVQMGNVGQHYFTWRYNTPAPPAAPSPTPAPALPGANDSFVHVSGNQLTYAGQPVTLKGTNYWRFRYPLVGTWIAWNGPVVQQELAHAKELGVNTIRIGIPYDHYTTLDLVWGPGCEEPGARCDHVGGPLPGRMTELLQIAAGYQMKVLFTLFELSDSFPVPGAADYQRQLNYLQGVVAPFANDDRVLGWDLHNEPENYATWSRPNGPALVSTWAANIAAAVHAIDPHHPVTVGVGSYQSLWAAAQGPRLIDVGDFVSFHSYDAGGLRGQIAAIQARTQKPILLEEMGWPSGPAELSRPNAVYDEATQQFLYRTMLADAKAGPLVGVVQWMLQDNPLGTTDHYIKPTIESWFGLVRRDGSLKPAAGDFRDAYPVRALPSSTTTTVPLTRVAN
jgi:hypothetical protein